MFRCLTLMFFICNNLFYLYIGFLIVVRNIWKSVPQIAYTILTIQYLFSVPLCLTYFINVVNLSHWSLQSHFEFPLCSAKILNEFMCFRVWNSKSFCDNLLHFVNLLLPFEPFTYITLKILYYIILTTLFAVCLRIVFFSNIRN